MATMRRFTEFAISLTHRRCRHLLGVLVTILVLLVGYAFLSGEISGKAHGHIQADECISDLGAISGAHIHSGRWNGECLSERYTAEGAGSRYARLYTFTLSQQSNIFIELTSIEEGDIEEGSAVPYLYLLQGQGKTGRVVAEDDDSTSYQTPNSRIAVDLEAGNYTIEATTYPAPRRGGFTLSVQVATSARGPEPWEVPEPHSVLKNGEGAPDDDESVAGTETRWDSVDATVSDSVPANDDPPSSDATLSSLTDSELQALMTRFSFWDNKDWDWYIDNIPFIETPDSRLDEVYYYRWEMVTKHLRYASPRVGYVATEFNDWPKYAGKYGAIVAPSGHQLYEMQWLRDRRFPQDYISLYFNEHSSKPYSFSSWLAENVWSLNKVHRNEEYAKGLLPELVKYYEHYEEMQFNPTLGLFWSHPIWDGMEYTVSTKRTADAFHGGVGYRPTLNSYMYANALAVQRIATMAGESNLASQYGRKATALKTNIQNRLWDEDRNFFLHMYRLNEHNGILAETLIDDTGPYTSDKKGREQMGFIPWAFNLPDDQTGAGYEAAWQYFDDPAYFQSAYGPRSAELSDHKYGITSRCCHWSGHSWPYATTQSLKALANVVRDYDQSQIDKSDYITALNTYVDVHMKGKANGTGIKPYIAEANQPDTGSWDGHDRADHSEHYFHSGFVDLVLTGLIGLQPQPDDTLILEPLVPATWDYFALDNLLYHGHEVAIIWDRDGTKYGRGPGFNVLVDEVGVHQSDTVPASLTINVGTAVNVARDGLANYAVNNTGKTYPEAIASNSFSLDPPSRATNGKYYYTSSPPDRWTSYNSSATEDWFRVDFGQDHTIHTVKLYFYDDGGGVQAPSSYRIQYWNGSSWVNVQEISRNPANPTGRRANVVKFSDVVTSRIRAVLSRNGGVAVGMTEFEAWGPSEPIPDSAADDNLALNADAWKYPRIFPSFAFINNSVFMVHDGDAKTFWSTRESRNGANEFLRVDFGEEKTFDRIDVNFRYAPTSMNLEYLNSGTWTAIQNVQMYPSTPTDDITTMAVFPAITAEQVRVNFTTSRLISVNEIEIHNSGLAVLAVEGKLTVHEGDDATYDVVLTRQPKADATVTVNSPTDNTEVTVAPATLTFTASNWNKEQTVTVAAAQDVDAVHDRATVTHTVSSTDAHYNGLVVEGLTVTVLDDEAAGLTARFEQVPLGHDGSSRFQLRVYFSEKVVLSYLDFSRALFETSGGTVLNARRLVRSSNIGWEVDVRPDGGGPVVITLPAGRACSISGAVCNSDGLWLTTTITATVPGPAPSVTSATALTVAEGATAVATLTATDADTDAEGLTWSIPGGADAPKFAITTDGALSFAAAKDFENPDDSGGDGTYEVTVQVSDGVRSSTADLRVTLIDVNEAPTADAGNDQQDVAQGATVTLAATATDPDAGDTLTYAWAQTSGDNVTLSATGTATVTFDAPTGLTEDATLVFTLTVSDTGGLTGQDVVSVITTPPGPAPSVTSATALTVAEGATAVATLTATDADTGAESLTWSIPGGADAPKFAITTDGALSFAAAKDFENPDDSGGDGTYEVTVQVSDGVRSSTADLRVTLIDVNEAPTADAGNDQGDVAQGATVTLTATATDPDAGDTLTYAWAQTSGDNVTLSATGTATVTFDAPTGLTEDATLVFTLTVSDTGGLTGQDVVSVITTPPGPAPSVTSATALTVAEGATAVATLTATDADTDAESLTWSIPGGADAPKFAITTDGALSFAAAKDFENPDDSGGDGTYEVTVQVSDGVRSSTADLRVTLIDVNEAPTADAGNDQGDVAQGATVTLAATATDPDAGDTLTYAWAQTSGDNVTLSATGTATVTFDAPTGLTEDATLVFTLTVTDTGGLSYRDGMSITVVAQSSEPTALPGDATLSALALSDVLLTPAFESDTETYAVDASVEVTVTTVSATTTNSGATARITPSDTDDNADNGHQVSLDYGVNTIGVLVTARDGVATTTYTVTVDRAKRWSAARAREWGDDHGWLVGANYVPRYAINQLEHWQADTFDLDVIDEELGWAADLGMNVMRVYLHDLLYKQDSTGFLDRIEQYLEVADKHGIATILVFFDDVWDPDPQLGAQPTPTPGVHNSGWVQSPGRAILGDPAAHDSLKPYVMGVIARFDGDERVIAFELYNEPGHLNEGTYGVGGQNIELANKSRYSRALLEKAFQWARETGPAQPVFASLWPRYRFIGWDNLNSPDRFSAQHSDIIGFHSYMEIGVFRSSVERLTDISDRPVVMTEYLARDWNTFELMLPILQEHGVGAINWGLVNGKSQTHYDWSTWREPDPWEPDPWFHDVLRSSCVPYDLAEAALIRQLTGTTIENEMPMFAEGAEALRTLAENTGAGLNVGAPVSAQDGDGDTLRYTLEGVDADIFSIVGTTGQLRTREGVDYDYEAWESYTVTIRVEDGQCGTDTIDVTIDLLDVQESATLTDTVVAGPRARFALVPSGHDGSLPFSFRLSFSEEVALSYQDFSGALFEISGGTVRNARRLVRFSNKSWEVHARPDGTGTVVITLPGDRACEHPARCATPTRPVHRHCYCHCPRTGAVCDLCDGVDGGRGRDCRGDFNRH